MTRGGHSPLKVVVGLSENMKNAISFLCVVTVAVITPGCGTINDTLETRKAAATRYLEVFPSNPLLKDGYKDKEQLTRSSPNLNSEEIDIIIATWHRVDWQLVHKARLDSLIKHFTTTELERMCDKKSTHYDTMSRSMRRKYDAYIDGYGALYIDEYERARWDVIQARKKKGQPSSGGDAETAPPQK